MNPSSRRPAGGAPRVSSSSGSDDGSRGRFGSSRWSDLGGSVGEEAGESADSRSRFGGSGWSGAPGLAGEVPEGGSDRNAEGAGDKPAGRRRRSTGPTHPRRTLAALGASVDVLRDDRGVAHLYAKTERDAYAALGFCMAEDRLWQMDYLRRRATGRAAELEGQAAAREDALVRTVGIPRRAAASAARLDGVAREVLAAFAAGVNAARSLARPRECERLGYEVEPWTLADSLAIELYLAWSSAAASWPAKILAAQAIASGGVERASLIAPRPVEFVCTDDERASLWRRIDPRIVSLISGAQVGAPAGHVIGLGGGAAGVVDATIELPVMSPSPMYAACVELAGKRMAGVAHVGLPGFLAGRNDHVAWGVAAARLDDTDCVLEEIDGIGNFRTESGWQKLRRRRETVRVRDGAPLRIEVSETRNGPLLSDLVLQLEGEGACQRPVALALRWGVNSLGTALPGLLALARASTADDVRAAAPLLDRSPMPIDAVGADAAGGVVRIVAGGRPVRDSSACLPVRGWCSEGRWTGVEALSGRDVGGPTGGVALATGVLGDGANEAVLEVRKTRLQSLTLRMHSAASLDAVASDVADGMAAAALPAIRAALAEAGAGDPRIARIAPLVGEWNGEASCASQGAAAFYVALVPHLLEALLPASRFGPVATCREVALGAVGRLLGREGALTDEQRRQVVEAFADAESWLTHHLGDDPATWTWGAVQTMAKRHPLGDDMADEPALPVPAAGSPFTVAGLRFFGMRPPFEVDVATAARVVADLSTSKLRIVGIDGETLLDLTERPSAPRLELVSGSAA